MPGKVNNGFSSMFLYHGGRGGRVDPQRFFFNNFCVLCIVNKEELWNSFYTKMRLLENFCEREQSTWPKQTSYFGTCHV